MTPRELEVVTGLVELDRTSLRERAMEMLRNAVTSPGPRSTSTWPRPRRTCSTTTRFNRAAPDPPRPSTLGLAVTASLRQGDDKAAGGRPQPQFASGPPSVLGMARPPENHMPVDC